MCPCPGELLPNFSSHRRHLRNSCGLGSASRGTEWLAQEGRGEAGAEAALTKLAQILLKSHVTVLWFLPQQGNP